MSEQNETTKADWMTTVPSCDEMGCSSIAHTIVRGDIPKGMEPDASGVPVYPHGHPVTLYRLNSLLFECKQNEQRAMDSLYNPAVLVEPETCARNKAYWQGAIEGLRAAIREIEDNSFADSQAACDFHKGEQDYKPKPRPLTGGTE